MANVRGIHAPGQACRVLQHAIGTRIEDVRTSKIEGPDRDDTIEYRTLQLPSSLVPLGDGRPDCAGVCLDPQPQSVRQGDRPANLCRAIAFLGGDRGADHGVFPRGGASSSYAAGDYSAAGRHPAAGRYVVALRAVCVSLRATAVGVVHRPAGTRCAARPFDLPDHSRALRYLQGHG
nr:hypothetical protein [Tanacetum cinerariifolium]